MGLGPLSGGASAIRDGPGGSGGQWSMQEQEKESNSGAEPTLW